MLACRNTVLLTCYEYHLQVTIAKSVQQQQSGTVQLTGTPVCRCCFQVDIGCGTSVVGNGAVDKSVPKTDFAHPLSMNSVSYQWMIGRGNWRAEPPDYGHYPPNCPRYHRFRVTRPGNFSFVSGVALFEDGVRLLLPFAPWRVQWRPWVPTGAPAGNRPVARGSQSFSTQARLHCM